MLTNRNEYNIISNPENYFTDRNNGNIIIKNIFLGERNNTYNDNNISSRNEEILQNDKVILKCFQENIQEDNENKNTTDDTTMDKTPHNNNNNNNNKKDKIFRIKKVSKIAGRRNSNKPQLIPVKHSKSSKDNITTKVKTYFINSVIKYVNNIYKSFLRKNHKKEIILLQKIIPKFSQAYSKDDNQ